MAGCGRVGDTTVKACKLDQVSKGLERMENDCQPSLRPVRIVELTHTLPLRNKCVTSQGVYFEESHHVIKNLLFFDYLTVFAHPGEQLIS